MPLQFGTDGVRGVAGSEVTPEFVRALGRAAGRVLGRGRWYVGRDTRISGPMLAAALADGLAAEGAEVLDVGVVPTPTVAFLSERDGVPAAVISGSHNPFTDNGIKLFATGGRKLADDVESDLEAEIGRAVAHQAPPAADAADGPTATDGPDAPAGRRIHAEAVDAYADHLVACLEGRRLDGLRLVVDCAHGSASAVAPLVFGRLGAAVTVRYAEPNGTNINDGCGSTHPEHLQAVVGEVGAQAGLAFDGDADRVVAVDETGALIDGDHLLAICALDMHGRGALVADTVVVTAMTNLGFRLAMASHGISLVETNVGDRYVLEALEQRGLILGGEQSGHIIFRDLATTGDGILTGLRVLDVMMRSGRSLNDLAASSMTRLPQVLRSVRVADREGLADATEVWEAVAAAQAQLGQRGRVLLRPSGTEPLVRIMVEAPTESEAAGAADRVCRVVEAAMGRGS